MNKLVWMSDPHFAQEGDVLGHDPRLRLQAAVDHINTYHTDAKMCIISGDMVNRSTCSDYEGVKAKLEKLSVPYYPMVGNHDDRAIFREVLPLPDLCMTNFIQYKLAVPEGIVICLDTLKVGSDAGELCKARREWLYETLKEAVNTPVFIFMHHPPMSLGLPTQDKENMENGQTLLELISEFDCVKYLFIGHVHRAISGSIGGIPFSTMRSVLFQAPPPSPEWTWDTFKPGVEAPNIGIVQLATASVNLHYEQFCEYQAGVISD
ncbi:MAG: phosphodiesterase [Granulosicoccus sp.]